ncbi:MAG: hypothetical protein LBG20_04140 [Holosporaceae bacterium]|nr:hypothetical protein [Holosporaceae bacterium]
MKSLKNNILPSRGKKKLCKTHNDKNSSLQKVKLTGYKSYDFAKVYHPLKRKKVKLNRLKFVPNTIYPSIHRAIKILEETGTPILSQRYRSIGSGEGQWSNEENIVNWLISTGTEIKRINTVHFMLKNKICSFNYVVIFANKKRLEMGLKPFYVEGITEY